MNPGDIFFSYIHLERPNSRLVSCNMKNIFPFSVRDTNQIKSDFTDTQALAKEKGIGIGKAVLGDTIRNPVPKRNNQAFHNDTE